MHYWTMKQQIEWNWIVKNLWDEISGETSEMVLMQIMQM